MTTDPSTTPDAGRRRPRAVRLYDRRGAATGLDSTAVPADLLQQASRDESFVWVDFVDPTAEDLAPWAEVFDLHPLAVDEAATGRQQPTVQGFGDQLFVVVWASPGRASTSRPEIPKLFLFLGDHFLLTVQRDAGPETFRLEKRFTDEPRYTREGPAGTLYIVLSTIVDHYETIVASIEQELAELEMTVFDDAVLEDAGRIYALRQHLGRLERPMTSLVASLSRRPDSMDRLIGRHPAVAPYLADAIDDVMGIGGLIRDQRDAVDTIVASHENNVAQQQNEDMRRISAYGALLAVPTVIAGLYGMNFTNLPGVAWDLGWVAVVAVIVVIDIVVAINFRKRKWL